MRPARLGRLRRHGWSLAVMGAGFVLGGEAPSALAQDPGAAPATSRTLPEGLRFGNALLRDRRYDLAADQFERFLKTNPTGEDLADARFGLGRSCLFLNDYPA